MSHIKQIVGGINLIVDVTAKAKKPTLYATVLMTHLFTNEEMRQGSVEPKETHPSKGKKALEQAKINLIKSEYAVVYITCSNHYCKSDTGPERNIEIQLSIGPVHFSFHLCPLKYYFPNRCAVFMLYLISTNRTIERLISLAHRTTNLPFSLAQEQSVLVPGNRTWAFFFLNYLYFG